MKNKQIGGLVAAVLIFCLIGMFQMGAGSFPNKGILRNNLCLPACRILMYKRMTLEI